MKLFFREYGEGAETLLILHGLFGMSDNWVSIGKQLSDHHRVIIPDARNHGMSMHTDVFTYEAMLEDLLELCEDQSLQNVKVLGHSMGGKLAMMLSLLYPAMVSKLVVADISPVVYPPIRHAALTDAMKSIDFNHIYNRQDLERQVTNATPDKGLQGLMLKNIVRLRDDRFAWKLNLRVISDNIVNVFDFDVPGHLTYHGPVLFIRGDKSDFIQESHDGIIKKYFPNYTLETIYGAGHWLHAEKPDDFLQICIKFISEY